MTNKLLYVCKAFIEHNWRPIWNQNSLYVSNSRNQNCLRRFYYLTATLTVMYNAILWLHISNHSSHIRHNHVIDLPFHIYSYFVCNLSSNFALYYINAMIYCPHLVLSYDLFWILSTFLSIFMIHTYQFEMHHMTASCFSLPFFWKSQRWLFDDLNCSHPHCL